MKRRITTLLERTEEDLGCVSEASDSRSAGTFGIRQTDSENKVNQAAEKVVMRLRLLPPAYIPENLGISLDLVPTLLVTLDPSVEGGLCICFVNRVIIRAIKISD